MIDALGVKAIKNMCDPDRFLESEEILDLFCRGCKRDNRQWECLPSDADCFRVDVWARVVDACEECREECEAQITRFA